jgi:hypothetical protein
MSDDGPVPPRGPSGRPPPPSPPPPPPGGFPPGGFPPRQALPGAAPPWGPSPPAPRQGPDDATGVIGGRALPIRPMSVGDVLDGAFGGLRATIVPVALLIAVVLGPVQLALNLALSRFAPGTVGGGFASAFGQFDDSVGFGSPAFGGITLLFTVVSGLITLLVSAACIALLLQVDRGESTDAGQAVRRGLSVFGATVGGSVLLALGGIIGMTVLIMVGVLVSVGIPVVGPFIGIVVFVPVVTILGAAAVGAFSLVVPIAVIERQGPVATVGRALWVLRGRFWRLIGITLLVGLLAALATLGLQLPFVLLSAVVGPLAWIIESIGEVLAQIVVVPVTAFAATLVYLDARVRYEGLDLQVRSRGIGGS